MKRLLEIARPQIGVVTAIGETPVHIEFFAGREAIIREKARMITSLPATGFAVLNADDPTVLGMGKGTRAHSIVYGTAGKADVLISNIETDINDEKAETSFKITYGGSMVPVRLENVLGAAQVHNAAAAAAVGLAFGINLVKVAESLNSFTSPPGRMKVIPGIKGSIIIDDTYNSSPLASREALNTLSRIRAKRKIAVIGDMLELGKYTIVEHQKVGQQVAGSARILFTVGDKAKFVAEAAAKTTLPKKNIFMYTNVGKAGLDLQSMIEPKDVILIKGSQSVRMEKIVKEIMAEPDKADMLLVRQSNRWLDTPGMYD